MAKTPAVKLTGETVGTPEPIGTITVGGTTYTKYRKIIDCGALPNNASKTVASGISPNQVLTLYGVAQNTTNRYHVPMPSSSDNAQYTIELHFDASQNILIKTHANRTAYNQTFVTIEYY